VFDQTCFSFLIYDPIIAQGQLQGRVLFRGYKNGYASYQGSFLQLKTEVKG